jgi:RimJ/RimL family protein N-acetyltransferase
MAMTDANHPHNPPHSHAHQLQPHQLMPTVPVLTTDRLTMRGHRLDDFADLMATWADPEVTRFLGGRPFKEEEVWTRLLRYVGHWAVMGFGYWCVRETATDRFVGDIGFADYKRDIVPSITGTPELGWVMSPSAQGKGYATEAVRAALAWGESHFGNARSVCLIDPENQRSLRVAEKAGYRERMRTTYHNQAVLILDR